MSLLWAGPDWQARTGPEAGGAHVSPAGQGYPRKPCSFPRGQCPPVLLHLGILASVWDFLYLGGPRYSLATLFLSLPCLHIGTAQERGVLSSPPWCPSTSGKLLEEPVLSLGRLYRSEGEGDAEAAEARIVAALLPEPCLRGDIGAWVPGS